MILHQERTEIYRIHPLFTIFSVLVGEKFNGKIQQNTKGRSNYYKTLLKDMKWVSLGITCQPINRMFKVVLAKIEHLWSMQG